MEQWMLAVVICFVAMFIIGCTANLMVIVAVLGDKAMRKSSMNLLLANLAAADFMFVSSMFGVTCFSMSNALLNEHWLITLMDVTFVISQISLIVSIYTNVAVCIERYVAVVHVLRLNQLFSKRRILIYVLCLWILSVLYAAWSILARVNLRGLIWDRICSAADSITIYLIPTIVLSTLYTKICLVLWSKNKSLYEGNDNGASAALKTRRSIVKMLILCVAIFYTLLQNFSHTPKNS
ncbi:7 transmembrane receptor (rhodopsin family) domain-containing protein [Ditylenchus destructor]|nr:7 transmembrane receptor (rhodopsin family) domain-containing protein [Ditylenchus destructor]